MQFDDEQSVDQQNLYAKSETCLSKTAMRLKPSKIWERLRGNKIWERLRGNIAQADSEGLQGGFGGVLWFIGDNYDPAQLSSSGEGTQERSGKQATRRRVAERRRAKKSRWAEGREEGQRRFVKREGEGHSES